MYLGQVNSVARFTVHEGGGEILARYPTSDIERESFLFWFLVHVRDQASVKGAFAGGFQGSEDGEEVECGRLFAIDDRD